MIQIVMIHEILAAWCSLGQSAAEYLCKFVV